jgi:hypothetical protein
MCALALKKAPIIADKDPELIDLCSETDYSQRMFNYRDLPRLLMKEEMSCNAATD